MRIIRVIDLNVNQISFPSREYVEPTVVCLFFQYERDCKREMSSQSGTLITMGAFTLNEPQQHTV